MRLPEVVVAERDAIMYEMSKAGMTYREIAKQVGVSEATAHKGVKRCLERMHRHMALDAADEMRKDFEIVTGMMAQIYPLTRKHKIKTEDGKEIPVPPSLEAVDRMIKLLEQKRKIVGYTPQSFDINVTHTGLGTPSLGKEEDTGEKSSKDEALELLAIMKEAGVMDPEMLEYIEAKSRLEEAVDAEVVDDGFEVQLELTSGDEEPPEWDDEADRWSS